MAQILQHWTAMPFEIPRRRVEQFAELDSTMLEARRNPEPGRIIVADHQTAGMGRMGRVWHSPPGEGLYMTYVLDVPPAPVISLALGLATVEAINALREAAIGAGAEIANPKLRWPNDVLAIRGNAERKVAGVLAHVESGRVVAGIGINVAQRAFPENLDTPATSLLLEGILTSRDELLPVLIDAIDRAVALPADELIARFSAASTYVNGRRVRAGEIEGVTCGLDSSGFLRVREDSGTVHTILNGGVRPA